MKQHFTHHQHVHAVAIAVAILLALAAGRAYGEHTWLDPPATPDRLELDLDGDTRVDTAAVVMSADGLRTAVQVCLSSREECDIVADSAVGASPPVVARRAPGCYEYLHEGELPTQPRPGNVCTTADLLEMHGPVTGASLIAWEPDAGRFTRYWLER
jgi:hypothetical protein